MTDFATQRKFMVDTQVRPSDVTDRRIIAAMLQAPREAFVPAALRSIAYMDEQIKMGGGRCLLAPRTLAKMLQNLDVLAAHTVLDIGVATGYSSAVLARLAGRVVAVESDSTLAAQATAALSGIDNIRLVTAALPEGFAGEGPYDAILINGAVASVPPELLDQLKDRGRLVAIQIERGVGRATLWRRFATTYDQRILFDAGAPVLPGFERKAEFVF